MNPSNNLESRYNLESQTGVEPAKCGFADHSPIAVEDWPIMIIYFGADGEEFPLRSL